MKLGKLPPTKDKRDLKFAAFRKREFLPISPPRRFGNERLVTDPWGMLGNDGVGDCVFAGAAHEHMVWCASADTKTTFTDTGVLRAYSDVTGYVPGNETTDQGTEVREALKYRRETGILDSKGTAHKIGAFVKLEPGNTDHLLEALYLFGAVGIGIRFPESAWAQFDAGIPWRIVSGSAIEDGHYVPLVARRYRLVCVTWGRLQEMTLGFYKKHCDEAWGILSEDMLKEGKTIHGFDLPALNDALQAVGSEAPQ